ncbi:hypothetical protein B0H99_11086 [Planomicrobium soli]|uniref:Uncharacterized protein n=1 Tax=Planomicrobium soli TaxID=1176648 RepID=A0A2P8GG55_9BACL|nr:hypothetical protein [Planomicrobium soli]PSL32976.1 hypothetical protein B0H99_11086 [Planomicrobium soli]
MEKLRKVKLETAVWMGICFYALTILIQVLILTGIIPLTWVNGGRSESLETQLPISIINILMSIFGGAFTIRVGKNMFQKYKSGTTIIAWFFVALWSFGFIQQLLGTPFEKMVMSLLLLLGVISNLRIAIEKRVAVTPIVKT